MKKLYPVGLALLFALNGCSPKPEQPAQPALSASPSRATSPMPSSSASPLADSSEFVIVAGQSFGPITAESTQATLEERFGKDQVRAGEIPGPEGITLPGLSLFPGQPQKEVSVFLTGTEPKKVSHAEIAGESSMWKTTQGVTLGTTLEELETLNGRPFEMTGFGWDYGGFVTDWKDGTLEGLTLRLDAAASDLPEEESATISGDRTISSDLPALRRAKAHVSQITVLFEDAANTMSATPNATESPATYAP